MIIKKTSSEWNLYTEILPSGQIAYETDTYRFKIGNGVSPWTGNLSEALPYATVVVETSTILASENLRIASNVIVLESDTNKFKIGNGSNFWNVLPYQKIVTASRFNDLQSRINLILGNGASTRGYGQGTGYGLPTSSYQVTSNSNVRANDINAVYADIVRARIHQIGTEPAEIKELIANLNVIAEETSSFINNDAVASVDTQGSRKGIADYEALMNTVDSDRFLAHPSQMSLETKLSSVRTSLWNGIIFHEFSVTFNNENHRRHFFNSGGNIRISSRNTNAIRPKGLDWDQILLNAGTVSFNHTNTTTTGSGTGSNIGNYDLTSTYVPIYQKIGQGTVDVLYSGNTYVIYAKQIDSKTISFKVEFNDVVTIPSGSQFDANIEGRLATTIQEYRASSSAVEVATPIFATTTALDTFGEPAEIYQLTTTKSTVREGEPFTIVLNTYNVPNGSTVPYVISGGVTAADLGLTSLVGNFVVNNNAASRLFTPTLDSLLNELTEEFVLTLNDNAASIRVNIINETLPTYNLISNKSTVEEGESFTITLNTTKIPAGTVIPYTITGITANDISPASLRGNFVVNNNNSSSVTFTTVNDNLLEGNETFRLELDNLQANISVNITDSQQITYNLTTNKPRIKEGESFIITLNTTFLPNGTQVPYAITGVGASDIIIGAGTPGVVQNTLSGVFTINNNTASVTISAVLDTQTNEGDETFNLRLVNNAANISVIIEEVILPTSANRTCIAVIDECSVTESIISSNWTTFRQTWPNRSFHLLQPNISNTGSRVRAGTSISVLKVPAAYTAETNLPNPKTFGPTEVNRDAGLVAKRSDWFTICNLGSLPNGSRIALFIDTSGSMNLQTVQASLALFRQKLAERNMQLIEVTGAGENWVAPFNNILN